jgi:hypothetical protein
VLLLNLPGKETTVMDGEELLAAWRDFQKREPVTASTLLQKTFAYYGAQREEGIGLKEMEDLRQFLSEHPTASAAFSLEEKSEMEIAAWAMQSGFIMLIEAERV